MDGRVWDESRRRRLIVGRSRRRGETRIGSHPGCFAFHDGDHAFDEVKNAWNPQPFEVEERGARFASDRESSRPQLFEGFDPGSE